MLQDLDSGKQKASIESHKAPQLAESKPRALRGCQASAKIGATMSHKNNEVQGIRKCRYTVLVGLRLATNTAQL